MNEVLDIPENELPSWMRQARQTVDWGVLLVIVFSLLLAWPFILQGGFPRTNASENYVYMTANYADDMLDGRLYPRWTAAALNGYGAPIPHYYPPGAPYAGAVLQILSFEDSVEAVRALYVLSMCLAGATMYAFVLRWFDARTAILASVLYVLSPYLGMTASQILGDLPGVMGMALLPTLMWSMSCLLARNRPFDLMAFSLTGAALLLTDLRTAILAGVLLPGFVLWYVVTRRHWSRLIVAGIAVFFSVVIASFYWLPALLEQDLVQWTQVGYESLPRRLELPDLLLPLRRVDLNEYVATPQFTLGLALVAVTAVSLVPVFFKKRRNRSLQWMFFAYALALTGFALLIMPGATWLLGGITFCLAVVAGSALHVVPSRWKRLTLPGMLAFALAASFPVCLAPLWPEEFGPTDLNTQLLYEQQGYGSAVLPSGSWMPITIAEDLEPNPLLVFSFRSENTLRLPQNQLALGRQANLLEGSTHADRYLVNTDESAEFLLLRAYFDGWQASLGGQRVNLRRDEETGLIRVNVPPVTNAELRVQLGPTSIRTLGWILSFTALGIVISSSVWRARRRLGEVSYDSLVLLQREDARLVMILLMGFSLAIVMFALPDSPFSLHARPGSRLDNTIGLRNLTSVGMEALSFRLERTDYHIGETLDLFTAWRTARRLEANYQIRVALQDMNQGIRWVPGEPQLVGGYPTRRWQSNRYVSDFYQLRLSEGLNPGEYRVVVELIDCDPDCTRGRRVNFFTPDGQQIGTVLALPQIITVRER